MQKRDARKLSPEELQEKRRQSVRLWKKGYTRRQIGEILEVHYNRIGEWIKRYSESGTAGIKVLKRGRRNGEQRRLSMEEELAIQKKIAETTPDQLKLAFALWTRRAVCELIERECGIKMGVFPNHVETMMSDGTLPRVDLHLRGTFTPKKAVDALVEMAPGILSKLTYPILCTPKLDGIRCLILPDEDGKERPVSRKFQDIPNRWIREELQRDAFIGMDGELMIRDSNSFQAVSSAVMREDGQVWPIHGERRLPPEAQTL